MERMSTPQDRFASAQAAIARGDLTHAHALISPLIGDSSFRAEALQILAIVERRSGNLTAALTRFNELLMLRPQDPHAHNNYANCLLEAGQAEAAVRHYKQALELDPDYVDAMLNLGLTLKNLGRSHEALPFMTGAVECAADNAKAWQCLGLVQRELGDLAGAGASLDESLRLAPNNAKAAHLRALVEAERGKPAASLFAWARALAPGEPEITLGLAVAQYEEGDSAAATSSLERLVAKRPDWVKGHAALAQMRWQLGDMARFARSFDEALRVTPGDVALQVACFGTLMRAGCYSQVLERLPRARAAIAAPDLFDRYEAVCASECLDVERADRAFERQRYSEDRGLKIALLRHLLRTKRAYAAARLGESMIGGPAEKEAWPYISIAWRLTSDPRAAWLDGNGQLVAHFDFPELQSGLQRLAEVLRGIHHGRIHPFDQSLRGGTQTDGHLFRRQEPELVEVRRCINRGLERFIDQLPAFDARHPFLRHRRERFHFVGSYSVRLRANGYHINHVHPDAGISCCFYVDMPPSIGVDQNDPSGWLTIGQPPVELGLDLPPLARVKPVPGRLALFPSIMWHGTVPFTNGERLTVVSDLAPVPAKS
jgi:Flp pilus assembly protein TadD